MRSQRDYLIDFIELIKKVKPTKNPARGRVFDNAVLAVAQLT